MRTSLRRISSMLWSEALRTVTPPTRTGSSSAIGVSTPVRPTDGTMLRTRVIACRGLNFHATAQRGARDTSPSARWSARSFTLMTSPSISKGSRSRSASSAAKARSTSARLRATVARGTGRRPQSAKAASSSACVRTPSPSTVPTPWQTRSSGGDAGVELLERARGGVARVGEDGLARLLALTVEATERLERKVDLAACLESGGDGTARPERERHAADGADVRGDILADGAVAARGARCEPAVLVDELDRDAVHLGLAGVLDLRALRELAHPRVELRHLVAARGVGEREHRVAMAHGLELGQRRTAHALRGGIGGDQLGMRLLERLQAAEERVVLGVGDLGRVEDVVEVVVPADLAAELLDLRLHVVRGGTRHRRSSLAA